MVQATPVPSTVTKTYPRRGPLQQFRCIEATSFRCFRCTQAKKSKLITIHSGDWTRKLCNACYGFLLSIYNVKAGTDADDKRADLLAKALLSMVDAAEQRQAERALRASERRANHLCKEALRFLSTSEHVAEHLASDKNLEWSPAVIGLCKAVEAEVLSRVILPLASLLVDHDLDDDRRDKDLGRIAGFCAAPHGRSPELGAFAHFLQTAVHSKRRRQTSPTIARFLQLVSQWTGSTWLLSPDGLYPALQSLTTRFRNPAAHVQELGRNDYVACRELVVGTNGMLWQLVLSTEGHKRRTSYSDL